MRVLLCAKRLVNIVLVRLSESSGWRELGRSCGWCELGRRAIKCGTGEHLCGTNPHRANVLSKSRQMRWAGVGLKQFNNLGLPLPILSTRFPRRNINDLIPTQFKNRKYERCASKSLPLFRQQVLIGHLVKAVVWTVEAEGDRSFTVTILNILAPCTDCHTSHQRNLQCNVHMPAGCLLLDELAVRSEMQRL